MAKDNEKIRKGRSTNLWFPFLLIVICAVVEYFSNQHLPVQGNLQHRPTSKDTETFSAAHARTSLNELSAFGPRVTGSKVSEVALPEYLRRKVRELTRDLPEGVKVEVVRQNPASNFHLDFLGGITNVSVAM
jgi:hypothetical protein